MSDVQAALERLLGPAAVKRARPRFDGSEIAQVSPASLDQMLEVVRFAASEQLQFIPLGCGSKLGWTATAKSVDFLLNTRDYAGVVSYEPGDGTLTARSGTTMATLRRCAAEGGHWITPDVPRPHQASLGGVLAASQSGPDRHRFGPVRHHVLGMRVLLSDATVAQSGGRLVKNVTGYDLHRLYCGSHGTLCIILEASLRLFPAPEHETWISLAVDGEQELIARVRAALDLPLRIVSLTAARSGRAWRLTARLFGKREPVEAEAKELLSAWVGAHPSTGDQARQAADKERDLIFDGPWLHLSFPAQTLATVLALLPDASELHAQPGIGTIDLPLPPEWKQSASRHVRELRTALAPLKGRVGLRNFEQGVLGELDPFGEATSGADLMRALKHKLDPAGSFASGRFHGRI